MHAPRQGIWHAFIAVTKSNLRRPIRIAGWWKSRPRRGVHILCQKPAALIRSDYQTMIDACARSNVRLMIHENWRFRHWYRAMRSEIAACAIERPIRLRIAHRDTRALRPDGYVAQP
jgi:predicted dehydrogenase